MSFPVGASYQCTGSDLASMLSGKYRTAGKHHKATMMFKVTRVWRRHVWTTWVAAMTQRSVNRGARGPISWARVGAARHRCVYTVRLWRHMTTTCVVMLPYSTWAIHLHVWSCYVTWHVLSCYITDTSTCVVMLNHRYIYMCCHVMSHDPYI